MAPRIGTPTVTRVQTDPTNVNVGTNIAGIGTALTFGISAVVTDAFLTPNPGDVPNPAVNDLSVDFSAFTGDAAGFTSILGQPNPVVTIREAGTGSPAAPILSGASPPNYRIRAADAYGNVADIKVVNNVNVDNVRPTPASVASFAVAASQIERTASGVNLRPNWTAPGATAADVYAASVKIFGQHDTVVRDLTAFRPGDAPLFFTLNDPFKDWVDISMRPVDQGGNALADPHASRLTIPFTQNATVQWGNCFCTPKAVKASDLGNVYINVTANGPDRAWTDPHDRDLFGELIRVKTTGNRYWNVSSSDGAQDPTTAVCEDGCAPGDTSLPGRDYYLTPRYVPRFNTANPPVQDRFLTHFQPPFNTDSPDVNRYVLTNLSNKPFIEGEFLLRIVLQTPGTVEHETRFLFPFSTDDVNPGRGDHLSYNSGIWAGAMDTPRNVTTDDVDFHGADGNPISVLVNVTDWRFKDGAFQDSKLRNVTFELYDPTTGVVPLRGSTLTPARVNLPDDIGSLSYLHDFRTPIVGCGADPQGAACVYARLQARQNVPTGDPLFSAKGSIPESYLNTTAVRGWINLTMPDLPPGKYALRVLAYDVAGNPNPKEYPEMFYRVGPTLELDPASLVVFNGKLNLTALASQYIPQFLTPDEQRVQTQCVDAAGSTTASIRRLCPVPTVEIRVSNSNDPAADGTFYANLQPVAGSDHIPKPGRVGYDGTYRTSPGSSMPNGTLNLVSTMTARVWPYTSLEVPLAPLGISSTNEVFVRAVVHIKNATGAVVLTKKTDWIPARNDQATLLNITRPDVDGIAFYATGVDGTSAHPEGTRPYFNVSFDRRVDTAAPVLTWKIYNLANPNTVVAQKLRQAPELVGQTAPRVVFNWSSTLYNYDTNQALPAGDYFVVAQTFDANNFNDPLDTKIRHFSINNAPVSFQVLADPDASRIPGTGTEHLVAPNFGLDFQVTHGYANLTTENQLSYRLHRTTARTGQTPILLPGEQGFTVSTVMNSTRGNPEFNGPAKFNVRVQMPTGAQNGDQFQLEITEHTNASKLPHVKRVLFVPLKIDLDGGLGAALVKETAASVLERTGSGANAPLATRPSPSGLNYNSATPSPKFIGFVRDNAGGAGIARVEVRVSVATDDPFSATDNKTWLFRTDGLASTGGTAIDLHPNDSNIWASSDFIARTDGRFAQIVTFTPTSGGADGIWSIPLTDRTLYTSATGGADPSAKLPNIAVNMSHKYKIDVRVTDKLGTRSAINTTYVTFDHAAPTLGGVNGALGVDPSVRSGITSDKTTVDWRAQTIDATMSVKVADNGCIKAVRLLAVSDKKPNTTVSANMSPVGGGTACSDGGFDSHGNIRDWSVNLRSVPHMINDVSNYTFWFAAEDIAGHVNETPPLQRQFRLRVIDTSPAEVRQILVDPPTGQVGGRGLVRATVFDNLQISHVDVTFYNDTTKAKLATGRMRLSENLSDGAQIWVADTTDDLNLSFDHVGTYFVNVTAYDINWNRSQTDGGPTCPLFCLPQNIHYNIRDDGAPAVFLVGPANNSTVNSTPTITFRALHKLAETAGISVKIANATDGNFTTVTANSSALNYTELKATNGTRQGWTVTYKPTGLADNTTLVVNASLTIGGLVSATQAIYRVDALAPTVSHNVTGTTVVANKTWATKATRVKLAAADNVSATTTYYTVNNGSQLTYTGEISPPDQQTSWRIEYWAVDAAGNVAAKQTLTLPLDTTGPRIVVATHGDNVLLTVDDGAGVGLNESTLTVHYAYSDSLGFQTKVATKVASLENGYQAALGGVALEQGLRYYFTASDLLGNAGSNYTQTSPYTIRKNDTVVTNDPPTITITDPKPGATVEGTVEIKWLAQDPEDASLTITIAIRDPAPGRVLATDAGNTGTYRLNTSGFAAGAYTVVVTASDGNHNAAANVTFNVRGAQVIRPVTLPPANLTANQQANIVVTITPTGKAVATANYKVMRGQTVVDQGRLAPSADNQYAAGFTAPDGAGQYVVVIDVLYSDGSQDTNRAISSFTIAGGGGTGSSEVRGPFPVSLMAVVALGILTAGLAAYGAFGRWRK